MTRFKSIPEVLLIFIFLSCRNKDEVKQFDICVYGGTSAGVISAYSARMMGNSVILIEPGTHIGGLSAGGLGQTDIGNKYAITGLSREFYRKVGRYYNEFEQWTFEPHIAEMVFKDFITKAGIPVLYNRRLTNVIKEDTRIKIIYLEKSNPGPGEKNISVSAKVFIDCSYEGDLMANSGVKYAVGRESNDFYGETYNGFQLRDKHQFPDGIDPYKIKADPKSGLLWGINIVKPLSQGSGDKKVQSYNFRLCLTDSAENRIPIDRPTDYDSSRYELLVRLIEASGDHNLWHYLSLGRMPNRKTDINNNGAFSTDMIGMNWDYPDGSYEVRNRIFRDHKSYTKGLLYFLGNDPGVPDMIRNEMLRWGYPKDEFQDNDHFTWQLYIREARRMTGEYIMTENNCLGKEKVIDPAGMAAYTMDSHNIERLVVNGMVKNEGDVQVGGFPPYGISYRAITPKREECINLLVPVCLSASHIAYGSIRMEPVFMVLGESAGIAASLAIDHNQAVQEIGMNELLDKLRSDPLLDGTPPDILIDNTDSSKIRLIGNWIKMQQQPEGRSFHNEYDICESGNGSVVINCILPDTGNISIYYYCTGLDASDEAVSVTNSLPYTVKFGNKELLKGIIPFREYAARWFRLAEIKTITPGSVTINAGGNNLGGTFTSDAVLVHYDKNP